MTIHKLLLGNVCTIGRGSSPRPIKDERFFSGGTIPWIKIADATASGKYIYNTKLFVNDYGASFSRKLLPGALIFSASGVSLGIPRILGVEGCVHDGWIYFSDYNGIDPEFLYYKLITLKDYFLSVAYGAAIQNINTDLVRNTEIELPNIFTQQRIAETLTSYDSLIETNFRRIALLEESARLLYREWFVKLRFPGHELVKVVDALPEGWELKPIADLAKLLSRGITPKYNDLAKGLIINQKCIREGRINLAPARHQSKEVKQDKLVQVGDILINSTGAGTLGRVAQIREEIADCTVDTHVTIVRPISAETMGFFGVALLELAPIFESMGRGATNQLELGRTDIGAVQLLTPPNQLQIEFHNIVWPIFEQVNALVNSCNLLAEARDALLPKLMSGQLAM